MRIMFKPVSFLAITVSALAAVCAGRARRPTNQRYVRRRDTRSPSGSVEVLDTTDATTDGR